MDHGMAYGMNSADTAHKDLHGIIKDFAQGRTATQTTIQNLTQGFPDLCAQIQQQSMMMIQQLQQQLAFNVQQGQNNSGQPSPIFMTYLVHKTSGRLS